MLGRWDFGLLLTARAAPTNLQSPGMLQRSAVINVIPFHTPVSRAVLYSFTKPAPMEGKVKCCSSVMELNTPSPTQH